MRGTENCFLCYILLLGSNLELHIFIKATFLLRADATKIATLHHCAGQTGYLQKKGGFPKQSRVRCVLRSVCGSTGWASAGTALPASGSACDGWALQSSRTSDAACGNVKKQGLSLPRFYIVVGLKRKNTYFVSSSFSSCPHLMSPWHK